MFKCEICKKEFKTKKGLNGHKQIHSKKEKIIFEKQKCPYCNSLKLIKNIDLHKEQCNNNPKNFINCKYCNSKIPSNKKFCDRSCAAKYNNLHRNYKNIEYGKTKVFNCIDCGKEIIRSIRSNSNKVKCEECKQKQKNKLKTLNICVICGNEFFWKGFKKTCSNTCKNYLLSKHRSEYLLKHGTTNFNTKQENFNYKFIKNMPIDSKLEKAALIYLVDILKIEKINRFKNILNFWENSKIRRTFNPDFIAKKDNKTFIIEVKMIWNKNLLHDYNRTIPFKKIALQKFCKEKNYELIWLDFDYDKKFKKIYKDVLNKK